MLYVAERPHSTAASRADNDHGSTGLMGQWWLASTLWSVEQPTGN